MRAAEEKLVRAGNGSFRRTGFRYLSLLPKLNKRDLASSDRGIAALGSVGCRILYDSCRACAVRSVSALQMAVWSRESVRLLRPATTF
jgi:hypothetical protein